MSKHAFILFTVGYEGRTINSYIELLLRYNIKVLCDVRKNPLSRKYGFSKKRLAATCQVANIEYVHMPDLGIDSRYRRNLNSEEAYHKLFKFYTRSILKHANESLDSIENLLKNRRRVALMCFEEKSTLCHRGRIADSLRRRRIPTEIVNL